MTDENESLCRVHEMIHAGKARGDNNFAIAAALLAVRTAFEKQNSLLCTVTMQVSDPILALKTLVAIERGNDFFAAALAALCAEMGLKYDEIRPILEQIEKAADADIADIESGKIDKEMILRGRPR